MGRRHDNIRDTIHLNVESIHRDVTKTLVVRNVLFVDHDRTVRQRNGLVRLSGYNDALAIDIESGDLGAARRRTVGPLAGRFSPRHQEISRDGVSSDCYGEVRHRSFGTAMISL